MVEAPITATNNKIGSKTASGTCTNILGVVAMGDCSIVSIAKDAGITSISTVDSFIVNLLGFYSTYTITITGE